MPLPGYVGGLDTTPEEDTRAAALSPSLESDVSGVLFTGGTVGSLTEKVKNFGALEIGRRLPGAASPYLTPEEANREYGIDGHLSFSAPVTARDAAYKNHAKRDELWRQSVLERNQSVGGVGSFGYSMVGGIVDPVSLGINFIPIAGEAKWGKTIADAGLSAKLARGAWAGGQGAAMQESLTYGLSQAEGRDYSAEDAAVGVLGGIVLGSGFEGAAHGLGGGIRALSGARSAGVSGRALTASEQTISDTLRAEGIPDHVIQGVMAGGHAESRLDPTAVNPSSGAFGIGQWLGPRKAELFRRYGEHPTVGQQAEFLAWELKGGDHGGAKVLAARDAGEALNAYIRDFMRPAAGRETEGDLARGAAYLGEDMPGIQDHFAAAESRAGEPSRAPDVVTAMDLIDQHGAVARAIDQMAGEGRVDMGDLIAHAVDNPRAAAHLDESSSALAISGRMIDRTETLPVNGERVPVQYAVVEASGLRASHDPDGVRNVDYPDEMQVQPRDLPHFRQALEGDLDVNASPVIGPDGTVEAFNAQVLKVVRAYREGGAAATRYKAHLESQGIDTAGIKNPVLVRVRAEAKSGAERVRIARGLVERPAPAQMALPLGEPVQHAPSTSSYGGEAALAKWRAIQAGAEPVTARPAPRVELPEVKAEGAPPARPEAEPAHSLGGLITDDPEVKALSAEVEQLRQDMPEVLGDVPAFDQPAKLVKAIAAYGQCLIQQVV
ncbi:phage tail tip lysozyme [Asticcacaulis taihuensis]|uniref:phage tail tip lysozyme n=1 Tax=Asticcacaulis taihuensis TaxID=260084 RepID=UPI0026EB5091|nr:phage tail tip lysozyme [Asticcacaulis taihuensis]